MTFTPRRWMFASSAWALGICMGASAVASEPNAAADAAGATGAAVAGGGKAAFWSRNNAKFALSGAAVAAPEWNAEVNTEDSRLAFTPEEQQELVQHLRAALERLVALPAVPLQVEPADGSVPATSVPATGAAPAALGLQARITQATMPNITRNMLVMALPIPIPGVRSLLRSRGGAGIDVALVRSGEAEPLVSFQCDYQAGMISILDSYRRLAQAKTAMERCVDKLARSAPEGRLVDSAPVPVVAAAETSTRTP
ncbi:MAG: hypothetical protein NT176_19955 [Proteobacteria bacterium]|nr:hypothetical protein [Pseudomonadota bacterium]